jgi:amino-acid N-acetyltransferase
MLIEKAKGREEIAAMLSAEKLPVDDLPEHPDNFFVATDNGRLTGVIGLEIYGDYGLLRSLAVVSEYRNKGIAGKLMEQLESIAKSKGLKELYLLTETAPGYFERKGFQKVTRNGVPEEVKTSSEFSHVCPVSAIVMKKLISKI